MRRSLSGGTALRARCRITEQAKREIADVSLISGDDADAGTTIEFGVEWRAKKRTRDAESRGTAHRRRAMAPAGVDSMKGMHETQVSPMSRPATVIALHCSGAGAEQWSSLGEALGSAFRLAAPSHYGGEESRSWVGTHAFALADEAARTIDLIDRGEGKIHLVGHSYGGGVALHVALARPDRIASLSLYEPCAFHLLKEMGDKGAAPFAEISGVARVTGQCVAAGDYAGAASFFVNYWSGEGTWAALRPSAQMTLIRWVPKVPLEFRALIEEPTPPGAYRELQAPTLVIRGDHTPLPALTIAEALPMLMPRARLSIVAGAGHMGPLTHASAVSELIVAHIRANDAAARSPAVAASESEAIARVAS
jgi:pimeloyl-ACP methyl ester carboxylesterase